jgi:cyclic beta-1,2-glucan synthetase
LKKLGGVGAYGFYEALDYGPKLTLNRKHFTMVRSWMAHHQGMCLLSVANVLCDSSISTALSRGAASGRNRTHPARTRDCR